MPALRTYQLFISHAWSYNEDYYRLVRWLDEFPNFDWRNLSVPEHDQIGEEGAKLRVRELTGKLDHRVRLAQCVVILSGMYVAHSRWIQTEIDIADRYNKPVVGIYPWGSKQAPRAVRELADRRGQMVGWNRATIVGAIRHWSLRAAAAGA